MSVNHSFEFCVPRIFFFHEVADLHVPRMQDKQEFVFRAVDNAGIFRERGANWNYLSLGTEGTSGKRIEVSSRSFVCVPALYGLTGSANFSNGGAGARLA